jgi:putative protease
MFSQPVEEHEISETPSSFAQTSSRKATPQSSPGLSIRVNSYDQALLALEYAPKRIYLSLEPFAPDKITSRKTIEDLKETCVKKGSELFLSLPRMMTDLQGDLFRQFFRTPIAVDGILTGHQGVWEYLDTSCYKIHCDTTMNLYNHQAIQFYDKFNISGWTASLELPGSSLLRIPGELYSRSLDAELVLHGFPTIMYMDHDVSNQKSDETILDSSKSQLRIKRDYWDRYHILPHKELSLLPVLSQLIQAGYNLFRVELQGYEEKQAQSVLEVCQKSLKSPENGKKYLMELNPSGGGFTYGAYQF